MSHDSDYFNLTNALRLREPFKIASCIGSTEARMSIKDELIRESLIHICDPSVLISDFWKGNTDINHSIVSVYHIYHVHDLTTLKRAIALMQQRFGDLVINQSPIIRCIMELIQLCESQSSKSTNKTITWSFTDWWGMENLEHSIINIAFNRIDNVNYNFCLPFEADIVVYNVYTYYHKLYSSAVTRIFWTNEHDFVDINYASLSLAPSNVFDISPHASIPAGTHVYLLVIILSIIKIFEHQH